MMHFHFWKKRMSKLLIVESPSQAKTINKYLGSDFNVLASYGHVRDLLPKSGAIDTDSFKMEYALIDRNKKYLVSKDLVGRLRKKLKKTTIV